MNKPNAIVIGAGFSGLSAACFLAKAGHSVTVIEKHDMSGGRARRIQTHGFTFDMGPSWYWMPDVFERFFNQFGSQVSNHYRLHQLDPAFQVIFGQDDVATIPADVEAIGAYFESIEAGAGARLQKFFQGGREKYDVGMQDLVYKPGLSWTEYFDLRVMRGALKLDVFQSYASHVRKYFRDPRLIRIMEFPVLFLGGIPSNVPALYSLMAYGGLALGTWYPEGGMYQVVDAIYQQAVHLGVQFKFNENVKQIQISNRVAKGVLTDRALYSADNIVAAADYHHVERELIPVEARMYDERYWESRVLAPSALVFYVGVKGKFEKLQHHNLFFDAPFDLHARAIYHEPQLPEKPLFYVCAPSVSDSTVAPDGHENLFVLIPLSPRLEDSAELRDHCYQLVMKRLEEFLGAQVKEHVTYCQSYAMDDYKRDYNALRGNAYGLANTLMQTAVLKPRIKSNKVSNLYYAGQMTVPGPGVPPALISGEIAASLITGKKNVSENIRTHAASTL